MGFYRASDLLLSFGRISVDVKYQERRPFVHLFTNGTFFSFSADERTVPEDQTEGLKQAVQH